MRADGKVARTVYTGAGVKSIEWIEPIVKARKSTSETRPASKPETQEKAKID